MRFLRVLTTLLIVCLSCFVFVPKAWAFCGFYVAKADAKLYNQASQVAIARNGDRTVLTMANDYQGEVKDFAIVVPVPVVLQKEQVKISNPKIIERLDAFSAPRLVEYFDPDPCAPDYQYESRNRASAPLASSPAPSMAARQDSLGVTVEAKFTVGEYDILILSAKESGGLETWLVQNGYRIPRGAKQLLKPYIRQKLKFFVAKVNLNEYDKSGFQALRPLQITYDSPRFMLPIRLGMINAQSAQDLIVYILSPKGQAEVTNYRTVKIPSDTEIPLFVKDEFSSFYKAMFAKSYDREDQKVAFLEYAWNMSNCDPCSADPLSPEELKQAGVFWLDGSNLPPMPRGFRRPVFNSSVFITRLHVRYTRNKFPEDLMFQDTNNQETFQGRYVLRHPFGGEMKCAAGNRYRRSLRQRFDQQAQNLARLTGWKIDDIRKKQPPLQSQRPWWQEAWMAIVG
ncbi:MAG: DUF2330 domain-containing protein [Leptolyngbyaceae cyanobacterium CSU_1_3]|nr:DUF2330 domain-containing protein [Leptolyngbyaceae cyanobacterium CSU_1_3]